MKEHKCELRLDGLRKKKPSTFAYKLRRDYADIIKIWDIEET